LSSSGPKQGWLLWGFPPPQCVSPQPIGERGSFTGGPTTNKYPRKKRVLPPVKRGAPPFFGVTQTTRVFSFLPTEKSPKCRVENSLPKMRKNGRGLSIEKEDFREKPLKPSLGPKNQGGFKKKGNLAPKTQNFLSKRRPLIKKGAPPKMGLCPQLRVKNGLMEVGKSWKNLFLGKRKPLMG